AGRTHHHWTRLNRQSTWPRPPRHRRPLAPRPLGHTRRAASQIRPLGQRGTALRFDPMQSTSPRDAKRTRMNLGLVLAAAWLELVTFIVALLWYILKDT